MMQKISGLNKQKSSHIHNKIIGLSDSELKCVTFAKIYNISITIMHSDKIISFLQNKVLMP